MPGHWLIELLREFWWLIPWVVVAVMWIRSWYRRRPPSSSAAAPAYLVRGLDVPPAGQRAEDASDCRFCREGVWTDDTIRAVRLQLRSPSYVICPDCFDRRQR